MLGMALDEREFHRAPLAKKAIPFPRMSRSWRSCATSRRNRRFILAHQRPVSRKHIRERPARAGFRLAPPLPQHVGPNS